MVRKFFAFATVVLLVVLMLPLLLMLSVMRGFFSEDAIRDRLVPASYPVVAELVAESFAQGKAEDVSLLRSRFTSVMPQEEYINIIKGIVSPVFEGVRTSTGKKIVLNLEPLRTELKASLPRWIKNLPPCLAGEFADREFRLCLPKNIVLPANYENKIAQDIERQIPKTTEINVNWKKGGSVEGARTLFKFFGLLPWFIAAVALTLAGILSLIVFSPVAAILRWNGYAFVVLGVGMALLNVAAGKLMGNPSLTAEFTVGQKNLMVLLVSHALSLLTILAYFSGALGAGLFGAGWWLTSKKTKGTSEKHLTSCNFCILAANVSSLIAVSSLIRRYRASPFSHKIQKFRFNNLFFRGS